jgi:hypothetical protein
MQCRGRATDDGREGIKHAGQILQRIDSGHARDTQSLGLVDTEDPRMPVRAAHEGGVQRAGPDRQIIYVAARPSRRLSDP